MIVYITVDTDMKNYEVTCDEDGFDCIMLGCDYDIATIKGAVEDFLLVANDDEDD